MHGPASLSNHLLVYIVYNDAQAHELWGVTYLGYTSCHLQTMKLLLCHSALLPWSHSFVCKAGTAEFVSQGFWRPLRGSALPTPLLAETGRTKSKAWFSLLPQTVKLIRHVNTISWAQNTQKTPRAVLWCLQESFWHSGTVIFLPFCWVHSPFHRAQSCFQVMLLWNLGIVLWLLFC